MALHEITGLKSQFQEINTTSDTWIFDNETTFANSGITIGDMASYNRILFNGDIATTGTGISESTGAAINNIIVGKDANIAAGTSAALSGDGTRFANYGTMGSAANDAKGGYVINGVQEFRNFGTIEVTGGGASAGIFVAGTTGLTIENHDTINAKIAGIDVMSGNVDIVNAEGGSISGDGFAIRLGSGGQQGQQASLINAGHISSDNVAIEGSLSGDTVSNTGKIDGKVTLGDGNDHFSNAGTVNGEILLGDGSDTIDLRGGTAGNVQGMTPKVEGGEGNDTYIVDKTTFDLHEEFGGGIDMVKSSTSFALGNDFENLTLIGNKNIDGNGNGFDNAITGNAGNNILNGMGGEDLIDGGAGIDTLVFDASGAKGVLVGLLTGKVKGADDLYSFVSNIENVRGTQFVDVLNGSDKANVIEGGEGGDLLNGNGGMDTLSYQHSSVGVSVDLKAHTATAGDAEGDTILSLENLQGSFHDDTLAGNDAKNRLTGGQGNDHLTGYGAADVFVFTGHFGKDEITDFASKDRIDFSQGPVLFKNFDAMMDHVTVSGDDLVIHHGKDTLRLDDTDMSDLHASQFLF